MNQDILDEVELIDSKAYYNESKKNLKHASILILGAILLILISTRTKFLIEIISLIGAILLLVAVVISAIGIGNGIKSYIKKEKHSADRFLVLLGNLLIFAIFILVIIANTLDVIRYLKG